MQIFALRQSSPLTRGEVLDWAVVVLGCDLSIANYRLAGQTRHEVTFTRDTRGLGIWLITIVTFPLGLIAYFLGKRTSLITVRVEKGDNGDVDVSISGTGTRRVVEGVQYRMDHDLDMEASAICSSILWNPTSRSDGRVQQTRCRTYGFSAAAAAVGRIGVCSLM